MGVKAEEGMEEGLARKREGREEGNRKEGERKRSEAVATFVNFLVWKGDKYKTKSKNYKLW